MKKNMGNSDKVVRIIVAVVISILYFTNSINGTLGIVPVSYTHLTLPTSDLV